jgi:uncharacterized protein YkwD
MNRARMFFSTFFAVLTLTASASAFAAPKVVFSFPRHTEIKGYRTGISYDEALEQRVLEQVNAVRGRYGLSPLRTDSRATLTARQAAAEASREGGFGYLSTSVEARLHDQGINASYEMGELYQIVRENRLDATARTIVKAWLRDPSQSRLLLDEDFTYGGVGAVRYGDRFAVSLDAFGPHVIVRPPTHC